MGTESGTARRLDSLTGLRAVAALMVFAHHAVAYGLLRGGPLAALITRSGVDGVSFFFILSGFVLAWSWRPGDRAAAFWRRRAARILPLYWIGWLGGAVLVGSLEGRGAVAAALPSLPLLQAWVPSRAVFFAGNSPGWSLSCEVFFYAVFPLLVPAFARLGSRPLWAALGAVVVLALVVPVLLHPELPTGLRYWAVYVLPPARLPEFAAGVAVALLVRRGAWPSLSFPMVAGVTALSVMLANLLPLWALLSAATVVPFILLVGAAAMRDLNGRGTLFGSRVAVRAGEWSFAFYLVHLLIVQVAVLADRQWLHLPSLPLAAATLAVSVACSGLLCERVEKPLSARFRVPRPVLLPVRA